MLRTKRCGARDRLRNVTSWERSLKRGSQTNLEGTAKGKIRRDEIALALFRGHLGSETETTFGQLVIDIKWRGDTMRENICDYSVRS